MTSQQFPSITPGCGYELVHRSCIVRLGPECGLYTETNHASVGVLSVHIADDLLVVRTDFDGTRELCVSATADADASLALKGVTAGASGGGSVTKFAISSSRPLPYGSGPSYRAAYTQLPPNSAVFNSTMDNLWINFLSIRPVAPCPPVTEGAS